MSCSSAPSLAEQYPSMVRYTEALEAEERVKFLPHLTERAPNREIDDVRREEEAKAEAEEVTSRDRDNGSSASLVHRSLKDFSLDLLSPSSVNCDVDLGRLTRLDLSNNELSSLPGLSTLPNLEILCIKRNWFNLLPKSIGKLTKLRLIDASRNFLKPKDDSLHFDQLRLLKHLQVLDLSLNQKCRMAEHREFVKSNLLPELREVEVRMTVWQEASNGGNNCIGRSAAVRDPKLLRSQLEPWGTVNLRRRLVRDFGREPTDPKEVDRAGVMEMLLGCYREEGRLRLPRNDEDPSTHNNNNDLDNLNLGVGTRRTIDVDGTPVRKELLDELLAELRSWRGNKDRGGCSRNRERPSINATCYMILCAPNANDKVASSPDGDKNGVGGNGNKDGSNTEGKPELSRRDRRRAKKMRGNARLWELALRAMKETDPEFAARCSEIAVTYGFVGSPHIDRQNSSPFYGLALGNFGDGTGGIVVECSARVLARVNTKNRLGRVDGRHPHWVDDYDRENEERFSLIYYDTLSAYQQPGPAVFTTPV